MNVNGNPDSGGTLEFYRAGTSTPQELYSDADGTSVGTSVTLNSRGLPEAGGNVVTLYHENTISLKIVWKNASGQTIYTADNLTFPGSFDSDSSDKLAGVEAGADVTDAANVGAVVNGKQAMWVPHTDMTPTVTNGAQSLGAVSLATTQPNVTGLHFDPSTKQRAQFAVALPKRWNLGALSFVPYFVHQGGNTAGQDGVAWSLKAVACANTDSMATAFGTAQTTGRDGCDTANTVYVASESADITVAGGAAQGEIVFFEVAREVDSSSPLDDLDINAILLGIKVFWTSNALNDA